MRKTKEESQITRERIIEASYELIRQKGYEHMTREDIARQVGMTRGAVNWHFTSKEEIYLAVLNKILDDFQQERRAYYQDSQRPPEEKIVRLISMPLKMRDQYRFINDIPGYLLEDDRFREIVDRMAGNRQYFIEYVQKSLTEIEKKKGKIYKNKEALSQMIYFLHEGLHSNYAETAFGDKTVIQKNYKQYVELLLDMD